MRAVGLILGLDARDCSRFQRTFCNVFTATTATMFATACFHPCLLLVSMYLQFSLSKESRQRWRDLSNTVWYVLLGC